MADVRSVTVYCSSSRHVDAAYLSEARALGTAIANAGWKLIYGGNRVGCMGELADGAQAAGGKVMGITPQLLVDQGIADEVCDQMIVTAGMRERKALLEQHGDAFIAFPGGLGTFEEVFEVLVGKILGYHQKPIVFLNVAGYYDPLLAMVEHGIEHRFIKAAARKAYVIATTVRQTIEYLKAPGAEPAPGKHPVLPDWSLQ
jgi:hypothetical protein